MENKKIIDVHSHFLPEQYLKAITAPGVKNEDRYLLNKWSVEEHL